MQIVDSLLRVPNDSRTKIRIILWWELRRILFNFIVLLFGLISLGIMSLFIHHKPGSDSIDPLLILFFAFVCNIAYTIGWIIEIFLPQSQILGPRLFKIGLFITLALILLLALSGILGWVGKAH